MHAPDHAARAEQAVIGRVLSDGSREGARGQEEEQRTTHAQEQQRGCGIAEQHVLEHVSREQVAVADLVQRGDERSDAEHDPDAEEPEPSERCVI